MPVCADARPLVCRASRGLRAPPARRTMPDAPRRPNHRPTLQQRKDVNIAGICALHDLELASSTLPASLPPKAERRAREYMIQMAQQRGDSAADMQWLYTAHTSRSINQWWQRYQDTGTVDYQQHVPHKPRYDINVSDAGCSQNGLPWQRLHLRG